jgi:hypothetical protein
MGETQTEVEEEEEEEVGAASKLRGRSFGKLSSFPAATAHCSLG